MTREEADRKLRMPMISGGAWQDNLLNALERLGLLKFEEAPKKQVEWKHSMGFREWFTEGYNPNVSDSRWTRVNEVKVEIGKFTRIRMANGSYVQGYIESLEQP